jgi:peptidyl-prolyl cis-trans isomerase A (cyclophilin A)
MKPLALICFGLMTAFSQDAAPLAAPGTTAEDALAQAPVTAPRKAATKSAATKPIAPPKPLREPGLYATIKTSMGDITAQLFEKQSPLAVKNFVGLAKGTKMWTDPRTGKPSQKPLYTGTIFHRVIPNFMIQGGDPMGNGMGTPGYKFDNENSPNLTFDRKGRLAMANAGPNTNGSQFFVTVAPYPSLNGGYSIFGQVIEGQDVVDKISQVPRDPRDKPLTPVTIARIVIERVGPTGTATPAPAARPHSTTPHSTTVHRTTANSTTAKSTIHKAASTTAKKKTTAQ